MHVSQERRNRQRPEPAAAGWSGLFRTAFRGSKNAMVLLDEERCHVDVNGAYLRLIDRPRKEIIGHPIYEFVRGGPVLSEAEWHETLAQGQFSGSGELVRPDGSTVSVQYAAHTEVVTGKRLVLFVGLSTSRIGRHFRRDVSDVTPLGELSERERQIVRLVANGESGPEIADELHISHNTVRTHVRNSMEKLGARSRAHLVAKALAEGLVLS
jgi:DNA-binding CsgD family transcriptional regulator